MSSARALLRAAAIAVAAVALPDGAVAWEGTLGVPTDPGRPSLLPVSDRPWPFNGRITNLWDRPVEAWSDTRGAFVVEPGQSTPWDEDVDYAEVGGHWYKIGPRHLRIDASGHVTGFTCEARAAGGACV